MVPGTIKVGFNWEFQSSAKVGREREKYHIVPANMTDWMLQIAIMLVFLLWYIFYLFSHRCSDPEADPG